jgi:integrase
MVAPLGVASSPASPAKTRQEPGTALSGEAQNLGSSPEKMNVESASVTNWTAQPRIEDFPLLSSCISEYLAHVRANFSRKTLDIYALALKTFIAFAGDIPVGTVNAHVIDRFKVCRIESVSIATVNLQLRVIKSFFNCLKRWEIVAMNPCDTVRQIRGNEISPVFLTTEELQHLLKTLEKHWLLPIVVFAAMTGARLGEVLNLTWADIDLPRRLVCIRSSSSYRVKGGKVRTVPLNQTVLEVLGSLPRRDGLVFRGVHGGHACANHVSRTFRHAVRAAGLDRRVHFHSLRHGFASHLVQKGVSLYQVQKLLGHASPRVTEVYSHLQGTQMHEVVNMIDLV